MKTKGLIKLLVFFLPFLACLSLHAQTLTLYVIPPSHSINWKTPHHLAFSMVRNFLTRKKSADPIRPLGHIIVELNKEDDTVLTGIVPNKSKDFFLAIFPQKYGLGVLFKLFEGHLEIKENLIPEIEHRKKTGKIAFVSFAISNASYLYLKKYIDSFQLLGYDKLYNGLNEPRHGEGSGCSAFGVSFLELINILDPEFGREWSRDISIANKMIGGEITGTRVAIGKVVFSFRWAKEKSQHTHLKLYDPELIYSWIQKKYAQLQKNPVIHYSTSTNRLARGIFVDCRQLSQPQFPMFPGKPAQ